jgi:hypothetical protein
MPETAKAKKEKYQVMMYPEMRRRLRLAAAYHNVNISTMLHDCVEVGLHIIERKPPKPSA